MKKKIRKQECYYEPEPKRFFITGDKHRDFCRVKQFCEDMHTDRSDVLIILGDSGFNYYEDERDDVLKREISELDITVFSIHGNKENRPQNMGTYGIRSFCGGKALFEPRYPNLLFAIDGEIYTFGREKYMAIGGAHSVDKKRCLEEGLPFWEDEMPSDEIKSYVESRLVLCENKIHGFLTHTCPIKYLPTEMFMSTKRKQEDTKPSKRKKRKHEHRYELDIDRSTEEWLDRIEEITDYKVWYCGHYHVDKPIDKMRMMFREIRPLEEDEGENK